MTLKSRRFQASATSVYEVFAVLGCYATYVDSCVPTFWDNLLVPSSLVKQLKDELWEQVEGSMVMQGMV